MDQFSNDELKLIENIEDLSVYQDKPIKKKSSWFNGSLSFLILVLFVLIGIIIAIAISL